MESCTNLSALTMKFLPKGVTLAGALENNSPLEVWSSHVRRLWPIYLGGSLAVIFTNVADVMIPRYVATAIDTLTQRRLPSFSELYAPLLMFLFLAFIGRIYWRRLLGQQTHFVAARLRSLLWDRARFFSKDRLQGDLSPGELMNMATSDIGIARFMFGFTLVGTVDFLFLTILSLASMWLMDPTLTLATLIVFPAVPFLVHRLAQREEQDHRTAQDSLAQLTDLAAQAIATQRLQRVSQTHQFWEEKLKQAAEDYCWKHYRVAKTSLAFIPATGFAPLVAFGILLALGIQKVLSGQLSIGEFVALQSYIFLVQQPMLELGVIVSEWQRAHASLDRVLKTLRTPEVPGLRTGGVSTEIQELVYRVENLHYRIPGTDRVLLENLSFSLKRGDRLGVTGPIGCGKSTLLEILSGLETRYTGNIELWGRPIAEYAHDSLRRRLAIVPQRPFLFNDTIRSNVQMHREELSDADIWHWLEVAGVREDVEAFPERLDTRLGEWGVNLSGGQKQRLTLARALAGRPDVLLLDDCLSAVDTLTEERILAALDRELAQTTLIWVAHRPSTLKHCTRWLNLAPTRHTS